MISHSSGDEYVPGQYGRVLLPGVWAERDWPAPFQVGFFYHLSLSGTFRYLALLGCDKPDKGQDTFFGYKGPDPFFEFKDTDPFCGYKGLDPIAGLLFF